MKKSLLLSACLVMIGASCIPSGSARGQGDAGPAEPKSDAPAAGNPADNAQAPKTADEALAAKARDLLDRYCYECHGAKQEAPELNVKLYGTVVGTSFKYFVPRNLAESAAWTRISEKTMPPDDKPQPTDAEIAIIKEWIEKGAIAWPFLIPPRPFVSEVDILTAIRDDLRATQEQDRPFRRYFSLHNLHNNWSVERIGKSPPVEPDVLNLARAALSKACNSMSWESQIVVPKIVDKHGTVLRIDLRDLGWDKNNQWPTLLRAYPYGLRFHKNRDPAIQQLANEVAQMAGNDLPCVRLDWFIDTATRPKLYKAMLQLPDTIEPLEKKLNVDVKNDFIRDRLVRAGFAESGVSRNNRLVDRHPAAFGAYWKSYDFAKAVDRGNLFQFPLGPEFDTNDFGRQAFQHDGGEMIFNLPNGLQGYYLSLANGKELEEGPVAIVRDIQETSGTPVVVNGLSCMACHTYGMKRFTDTIRKGLAVAGDAANKVDRLFPTEEKMNQILDQDEERFLRAAALATAPFLNPADPSDVTPKKLKNYKEPVGFISRMYQKDLSLEEAAFELGFEKAGEFKAILANSPELRALGFGALVNGAAIKREDWAFRPGKEVLGRSKFHRAAFTLDRGTPHLEQ